ncbi:CALM [Mytilus coruscus]|uniref:CALM n=1 Tax=Mytilus coruscus TaxID=42192 RepID=A0A6J8DIV9_MYTCO|nr:CALM [Mytilus coruscus]
MATNSGDYLLIEFQDAFDLFAVEGSIDFKGLRSIMKTLQGSAPNDEDLKSMMKAVDSDDDEWISFDEFMKILSIKFEEMDSAQTVREAFKSFDINGIGEVSTDHLRHVLTNADDQLSEDEINNLLKDFTDKTIKYEDFIEEYDNDLIEYRMATKLN